MPWAHTAASKARASVVRAAQATERRVYFTCISSESRAKENLPGKLFRLWLTICYFCLASFFRLLPCCQSLKEGVAVILEHRKACPQRSGRCHLLAPLPRACYKPRPGLRHAGCLADLMGTGLFYVWGFLPSRHILPTEESCQNRCISLPN